MQLSEIRILEVNKRAEAEAVEEKVAGFLRSLSDAEVAFITAERIERVRRAVNRHRNRLAAYRVEAQEARRAIADAEAQLEGVRAEEARALRSKDVEAIAEVQRRRKSLEARARSYREALPSIEQTVKDLEATG